MLAIFKVFFALGCISFGGPAAHIGYFRQAFVEKRKWLDENEYGQLVALSQFLPGPGSSQVGFALGYKKGGVWGGVMAFLGFTLPSVVFMLLLVFLSHSLTDSTLFQSVIHGLKLLAVVVVADATWGMYKNFCQSKLTVFLCLFTATILLVFSGVASQVAVLLFASVVGLKYLKSQPMSSNEKAFKPNFLPLILFVILLFGLPLVASSTPLVKMVSDFFTAGSLVFGGGHVVLPLLESMVGDQLSQDLFLTGYAAAQAVPGPMFTFATYLGYELWPQSPVLGALMATLAVFLPGFLLLLSVLKNWQSLASNQYVAGALRGVNAAVVGLLLAALYQPVFVSAVVSSVDFALILAGAYLLKQLKLPIVWLVLFFMLSGAMVPLLSIG
ncbi:chromate efflux transporter [Vibrio sp. 99-8-1]|uniref:chromate efflux transporter n=1 Tax=Vibrio sp. 99-8-1 TaxID=2607602 RepID=UPI001493D994|nr:chromate efflux transporter [Vibrio sp. 99-8-1]NOI66059.1 chromate efflux transporter [Vibrio sp. 99-8-1]